MRHISAEILVNYLDASWAGTEKSNIEAHLSECAECVRLKQELQSLLTRLQQDAAFEPPRELTAWAVNLFQPLADEPAGGLRKFVASLVFDTYDQPMLAGTRHMGPPPRQLLFRAGDVDVDVKIESMEANDRITLAGQVLSSAAKFINDVPVKLESHGVERYRTKTNVVGEFSFDEIPKDTYHLSVDLPEGQITLFCVHRG
jgi:anti-sigma factor RsiW